jgi:hypothetical protein
MHQATNRIADFTADFANEDVLLKIHFSKSAPTTFHLIPYRQHALRAVSKH